MNPQLYRLSLFEEAAGPLHKLSVEPEMLSAHIGKIVLALPLEMEEMMRPYLGSRISILRTDNANKSYLLRTISDQV